MRKIIEIITKTLPSFYIDVPALRPGTVGAYALAFVSVGVATVLRLVLDPFLVGVQFITFGPAIIITTLISGFGAGFLCVVLSTAAADFFVLSPRLSFFPETSKDLADLLLFGPLAAYLVMCIAQMRNAIEQRTLRASKDRLQFSLDACQLGWWEYDPRRRVISGDKRFNEIFDVSADSMPIGEIEKLVHPDDAERFCADREVWLDPAHWKPHVHEYRVRRHGEVRWVEVHWLAYFEDSQRERGVAGVVGTVQDITERKEREEKEHLLMREVSHRGKNMLSVVHAIAQQTATQSPKDFIERFSERIQALAVHQDLLIRNEWRGVEIEDLVRAQLAPFAGLIGPRIAVQGPKLRLNAGSVQAIGLALHELATNAGKYGALSTETGRVDICWEAYGGIFTMSWTEREGPPVSAPVRRGFGTTVMKAMTERSVGGTVDLDYAPSGLSWCLACPSVNALEPSWEPGIQGNGKSSATTDETNI